MFRDARPFIWIFSLLLLAACNRSGPGDQNQSEAGQTSAEYIGRSACVSCHRPQIDAWTNSHHDLAMQEATDTTVLGDFDTSTFAYNGTLSTFFKRDGDFFVNTDGPEGALQDYKVTFVFGVEPLQQYLIAFPGGRLQSLGIAWDTRSISEGGQRWFHLYPEDKVNAGSPLHWTGPNQNWNYMCADCHSTNLQKNYDLANNRYQTDWSEIDVSCEACHGPASSHVEWANSGSQASGSAPGSMGLTVRLPAAGTGSIVMNPETGIARLEGRTDSQILTNTCAPCHSRRSRIVHDFLPGKSLLSSHRPSLLREGLYYPDGQIRDEVYVFGSFVQSKMFAAGVVCSDCHDSHSLKLRAEGNALCASCHLSKKFDTVSHTLHQEYSEAAQCVTCHMPERTYMVVDPRRDHSFKVPRPDISRHIDSPDVCTSCHEDQSAAWAAEIIADHFGTERRKTMHPGEVFHLAFQGIPNAADMLVRLANDSEISGITRGSALSLMTQLPSSQSQSALSAALKDPDPLVRLGAVIGTDFLQDQTRLRLVFPLLSDSVLAVRTEASRVLASIPPEISTAAQKQAIETGVEELIIAERTQEERPEAWMNIALAQSRLRRFSDAEESYRRALNINPGESAAYVNLSDLYRIRSLEPESEQVLRDGLQKNPEDPAISHALGLSLVRQQRISEALPLLKIAAENAPDNPRFIYVYAIAANTTGATDEALNALHIGTAAHPNNLDILMALATINRDIQDFETALLYARKLQDLIPNNPNVVNLVNALQAAIQ